VKFARQVLLNAAKSKNERSPSAPPTDKREVVLSIEREKLGEGGTMVACRPLKNNKEMRSRMLFMNSIKNLNLILDQNCF
jgi:hypothetical protein